MLGRRDLVDALLEEAVRRVLEGDGPVDGRVGAGHVGTDLDEVLGVAVGGKQRAELAGGLLLVGLGDGAGKVLSLDPIAPTDRGRREAQHYLAGERDAKVTAITANVLDLIEGFEGPYGVELLASTHWVAVNDNCTQAADAAAQVRAWTKRKGRIFTDHHVAVALDHLRELAAV